MKLARTKAEESAVHAEDIDILRKNFSILFANTYDGVSIHEDGPNLEMRRLIDCNERYAEMAGVSRGELLGSGLTYGMTTTLDFSGADPNERNRPFRGMFSWNRPDGKLNFIEYTAVPVQFNGKTFTLGIDHDVTERVLAERELHSLSRRNEALLAAIPDIVMEVDNTRAYRWANRAGREFFGDDVVGKEADSYFIGEQNTYASVRALFSGDQENVYLESWQRRKDGENRLLAWWCRSLKDGNGNIIGALSTARDITERIRGDQELREKTAFLEALQNSTLDGFLVVDQSGKRILQNKRCSEMWQIPREASDRDVDGLRMEFVRNKVKDKTQFDEDVKYLREHPQKIIRDEVELEDGRVFDRFSAPVVGADGTFYGRIMSFRDITEQKKIEASLRYERRLLRTVIDNIPDAIYAKDAETRKTLSNAADFRNIGVTSEEEVLGKTDFELFPEEVARNFYSDDLSVIQNGAPLYDRVEYVLLPNGKKHWILTTKLPLRDDEGRIIGLVGMGRNITEQKEAEEGLRKSESLLRLIFDTAFDGISIYEEIVAEKKRRLVDCNRRYAEMAGRTKEELLQISDTNPIQQSHVSKEEQYCAWDVLGDATLGQLQEGKHYSGLFSWIRPDGKDNIIEFSAVPINMDGKIVTIGLDRDITERRRAAEKLRMSEENFQRMADHIDEVLYTIDGATREFLYLSPVFTKMFGYTADEIHAMGGRREFLSKVTSMPDSMDPAAELADQSGSGSMEVPSRLVAWWRCKDESMKYVEDRSIAVYESNKLVRIDGVFHDLTAQHRAEEERVQLEEELIQSKKMETIGRLAGGIAHDFNNLLAPILGYSEMLLNSTSAENPIYDRLLHILKAAERARDLVHQLLVFSRKQVLELKVVDLRAIIVDFEKILSRTLREDIKLEVEHPEVPMPIHADVSQIEQILMNLAVNAQDAMPSGGILSMRVSEVTIDKRFADAHPGFQAGTYVCLVVSDTGVGMKPEILERMFEPFFTTKHVGKGTGLGLATVYGIVKQHSGEIQVSSTIGVGTSFTMYLPKVMDSSEAPSEASSPVATTQFGNETIMLVEDDQMVRDITQQMLVDQGYTVLTAENAEECLSLFGKGESPVDLLVSDIIMPGMNGKELFSQLRLMNKVDRVLYMSGYTREVILHHGILHGGGNFIQKPFTALALAQKVRNILDSK